MKSEPNSYKALLDALTRKHPTRVSFVMFFAGLGLADVSLLLRESLISNHDPVTLSLFIKILVGFALVISTLHSAFGSKNGNNT